MTRAGHPARTVLVVEDDPIMAALHQRVFENDGWEVRVADTVQAALVAIGCGACSVVVSDLHLPDGTGLDVLAAVREQDRLIPVIFVTGSPSDELATRAAREGALAYLTKPVARDALLQAAERGLAMVAASRKR
ncbi:MAG: response regulator [Verrucomicrobia bacterium]|nr:response regulator [Verrucomicrobiota bacterium]